MAPRSAPSADAAAERKRALRRATWDALRGARVARFPGARGRIPNFTGAEAAAERLTRHPAWKLARAVKCNPDLPQRPVRHRALLAGKRLLLPVPRLCEDPPFVLLDPADLDPDDLWFASSIVGAMALGRSVGLDELGRLDLVVVGCVAAARDGARLGKGGGYADLELALLAEAGRLRPSTPVVTTLHPLQVQRGGRIPMESHDLALDAFATPDRLVTCRRGKRRRPRLDPDLLDDERRASIPVLTRLLARGERRRQRSSRAPARRSAARIGSGRR